MKSKFFLKGIVYMLLFFAACKIPQIAEKQIGKKLPPSFQESMDSSTAAHLNWREYFKDPNLIALIDSALKNNQELHMMNQEIRIRSNEVMARKGDYRPFVNIGAAAGAEKVGRYTNIGASEATTEIKPGQETPEPLPDFKISAVASWELDIWHKLRNAKQAAYNQYLSSIEGKNFMVTNLIAEISHSYYELLALDNQLEIVNQNIEVLNNAVNIVRLQKEATRVTELAVKKFEAEVFKTKSIQFDIQQQIVITENRIIQTFA
jgi:outer membrane protein TolC